MWNDDGEVERKPRSATRLAEVFGWGAEEKRQSARY